MVERGHLAAVAHQRGHHPFGGLGLVAEELGGADLLAQGEPHRFGRGLAGARPRGARHFALALHRHVEAVEVDGDAARPERILGEVERKAVSVVERESHFALEVVAAPEIRGRLVEDRQSALQGLAEAGFLQPQRLGDQGLGADQLGIGLAHLAHQRRHQPVHQRVLGAQQMGMAHGAAHDAAQHIAAALVGGQHAVGDQERGGAQMVGDDAVGTCCGPSASTPVRSADRLDQGAEQVDVVIVVRALKHRGDALQPHAGIDGGLGQLEPRAAGLLLELHEDQIPDLDEAVAILVRRARRAARDVVAVIVEDLRARAAGAGVAHGPEIVRRRDADDALVGQAGDLLPQAEGLVVVGIDGDGQPLLGQAELLGDEVPGELDGAVLEVVAEREIAQHLEEGVVARGVADIVEVVVLAAGAHAFLRGGGAHIGALFQPGEDVLELHHAGIGEHQGGVVARHQRRGRHDVVTVRREIVEEGRSDFVDAAHVDPLFIRFAPICGAKRRFCLQIPCRTL